MQIIAQRLFGDFSWLFPKKQVSWKPVTSTWNESPYMENFRGIAKDISEKIKEKVSVRYNWKLNCSEFYTINGLIVARVSIRSECGCIYDAHITISNLFPSSLKDDFKNMGKYFRVKFIADPYVM